MIFNCFEKSSERLFERIGILLLKLFYLHLFRCFGAFVIVSIVVYQKYILTSSLLRDASFCSSYNQIVFVLFILHVILSRNLVIIICYINIFHETYYRALILSHFLICHSTSWAFENTCSLVEISLWFFFLKTIINRRYIDIIPKAELLLFLKVCIIIRRLRIEIAVFFICSIPSKLSHFFFK